MSRAQICFALTSCIARDGILQFFPCNLTVARHICVQPTVDYIGLTRTVGVAWVCCRFDHTPEYISSIIFSIAYRRSYAAQ